LLGIDSPEYWVGKGSTRLRQQNFALESPESGYPHRYTRTIYTRHERSPTGVQLTLFIVTCLSSTVACATPANLWRPLFTTRLTFRLLLCTYPCPRTDKQPYDSQLSTLNSTLLHSIPNNDDRPHLCSTRRTDSPAAPVLTSTAFFL
jgi:hypothetical protein